MATNQTRWVKNLFDPQRSGPVCVPGNFAAGSSQAIKRGELLELTGNSNTEWVPMNSDFSMAENVAIAACEIKSGDLAGLYPIIIPTPGDVFEFTLLSTDAQNPAIGTAVYYSSSEQVTTTAGSNILGNVAGWGHYPYPQGHAADDASVDRGTTRRNVDGGKVQITIENTNSYAHALQGQ